MSNGKLNESYGYELPRDVMIYIQDGQNDSDGFENTEEDPAHTPDSLGINDELDARRENYGFLLVESINRFADWNL